MQASSVAYHLRRSTLAAVRSVSAVRPEKHRAHGAHLAHAPVSPLTARHVTRPAAQAASWPTCISVAPPLRGRAKGSGCTACAALRPCAATSPARPLCALPREGRAQPRPGEGVAAIAGVGARGVVPSAGGVAMGGAVGELVVAGGGAACTAEKPWALPTPAPVAGSSGAGGKRPPPALEQAYFFGAASRVRACGARPEAGP